jgi:parallel beta helix pectate lyase-like protein
MRLPAVLSALLLLAAPAAAHASDLYVDPASGCSDAGTATAAANASTPWCSLAPASRLARPGDVVHIGAATYPAQFRPAVSGTTDAPIVFEADGPVTISAPAGVVSVMLVGVHDILLRGVTVHAAAPQGVWIDNAARLTLTAVSVTNTGGAGVQVKAGTSVSITDSQLVGNARAGLVDMPQAVGTILRGSLVSGNGKDGQQYNGDGVSLGGTGATVADDTISDNGDGAGFEHGIYAGPTANGYTIQWNQIGGNAGADVKAAGGPGVVADNRLTSSMFGVVVSDNPVFVTIEYNLIQGSFQHGILVTTGVTAARARLLNNTVQQTGRSTSSGNASAVFVVSAAQLLMRNNLFAYTNPDLLGSAFLLNDQTLVQSFSADTNWYASPDPDQLRVAWNGVRVTLANWQALSGRDASSISSAPPVFTADGHVASVDLGAAKGASLGLSHDLAGTPLPAAPALPDIGAYQSP